MRLKGLTHARQWRRLHRATPQEADPTTCPHNRELALLYRVGQVFSSSLALDEVLATVLDEVRTLFNATGASAWLLDAETGELICQQAAGMPGVQLRGWRLPPQHGIVGWTAHYQKSVLVHDAYADSRHYVGVDEHTGIPIHSMLSVPLKLQERVTGVIQVVDKHAERFTFEDVRLLENLAVSAAIAIENARLYEAARQELEERKRAEDALRHSEQRYRTLVEMSPDSIFVTDLEGRVLLSNPQTIRLYGFERPEEIIGQQADHRVVPEERASAREILQHTLTAGDSRNIEYTMLRKDGSRFLAELSIARIADAQGQPESFIGIVRDITQRKRVEETLRQRNRELTALNNVGATLQKVQELGPMLQQVLKVVLSIVQHNAGWIHLLTHEDNPPELRLVAQHGFPADVEGLYHAQLHSLEISRHVVATRQPLILESIEDANWFDARYWRERGQGLSPPAMDCFPLLSGPKIIGAMGSSTLPSRLITAEEAQIMHLIGQQIGVTVDNLRLAQAAAEVKMLRELEQLRARLITDFSHQLRTPLGLIKIACTSLLREDVTFDAETRREFLHDIESEADRLTQIVDNVLDLGKLESGHLTLQRAPTDLHHLITDLLQALENHSPRHTFVLDFPPTPLIADVDAQRIEQVLRNLLDNAIKYSPDGGDITITGSAQHGAIVIQITDAGFGIKPEELSQIFERYYRGSDPHIQHIRGVGLGLAVCQGIIAAHGGRIWVESQPQVGSTFAFAIPQEELCTPPPTF